MVEKKLNFNQPILSVRRYSPKMTSQIVDERKGNNALPVIHWFPPHRSELKSGPVRNPGAVPFQWEQSPGRPKEEMLARVATHLPPGSNPKADQPCSHQAASTTSDNEMEAVTQTSRFLDENSEIFKSYDSEDCSEAVVDGLDLDGDASKMMNQVIRPESAATTSEMCEHTAKRQQEEERKKVVNQDKPVLVHCRPSFEKSFNFFHYNKEEKEGSSDGGDQHENVITVCCLLPRSCLRSSVCNLNPVPAMSLMNRVMTFPASRILSGSSLSSSSTDSENVYAVKPVDKTRIKETEAVTKHTPRKKSFRTLQELLADEGGLKECVEKTIYVDTVNKFERDIEFRDDSESNMKTIDEMNMIENSSSEEEDIHIRIAVNKAAKNAKKQLSRARTLGNQHKFGAVPPPLPESPSDSWLFRTLPSVSAKKASTSTVQQQVLKTTGDYNVES